MACKSIFLGLFLGALVATGCYSAMTTEGLRCSEDAACNQGQACSYEGLCRVACNREAGGPECQANPDSDDYGCWEDPNSFLGGSCIPCAIACDGGCCPAGWVCGTGLGVCCPPWLPTVCPNASCAATPKECPA